MYVDLCMPTSYFCSMKLKFVVLCLLLSSFTDNIVLKCKGKTPCDACKNCTSCKYCKVGGGKCGVCK